MIAKISDVRVWEDYYRNKQGHERCTKQGCSTGMKDKGTWYENNHR